MPDSEGYYDLIAIRVRRTTPDSPREFVVEFPDVPDDVTGDLTIGEVLCVLNQLKEELETQQETLRSQSPDIVWT